MILNSYNNILVLAPHTDDGELGLGGTISKLIELGKKVTYVAFSTAQQSVPEGFPKDILKTEVKKATAQLGISPENLIIYNYEVRKLGYVRQEILEELIRLKKRTISTWSSFQACTTFTRITQRSPRKAYALSKTRHYWATN